MIDLVLVAMVLVSAILGLMRGFVGILVSTAAWLLAGLAAFQFGPDAALWLSATGRPTVTETFGGYALSFIVVLLTVGMFGAMVKSMVRASELSGADRALGFGIGAARGMIIACVLVLVLGFTPLPREPSWRQSQALPLLMPGVGWMRSQLPEWSVPQPGYRIPLASEDNGGLSGPSSALIGGALKQVMEVGRSSGRVAIGGSGANGADDPANVEYAGVDPANIETAGADAAQVDSSRDAILRPRTANLEPVAE